LKVRLDENIPYRIATALKAFLADRSGLEITWVGDFNPPGASDPTWLKGFSEEGGIAMVSGDCHILQHWPNIVAYIESGLICFFPPPRFNQFNAYGKASLLIRWWPAIIEKIKISQRGDCWRIPFDWTPDVTKFQALRDPRLTTADQMAGRGITKGTVHQFRPENKK
jgi:PIN like domain